MEVRAIFIRIEPSSAVPIYRQILDQIRYQVAAGVLREGQQMPSVRQLAGQLAVNQNTILKVYNQLCQEKILQIERGSGTFVAAEARQGRTAERKEVVAAPLREAAAAAVQLDMGLPELQEILAEQYEAMAKQEQKVRSEPL